MQQAVQQQTTYYDIFSYERRRRGRRQSSGQEFKILIWRIVVIILFLITIGAIVFYLFKGLIAVYDKIFGQPVVTSAGQTSGFSIGNDQSAQQNLTAPKGAVVSQFNILTVPPRPAMQAEPVPNVSNSPL